MLKVTDICFFRRVSNAKSQLFTSNSIKIRGRKPSIPIRFALVEMSDFPVGLFQKKLSLSLYPAADLGQQKLCGLYLAPSLSARHKDRKPKDKIDTVSSLFT